MCHNILQEEDDDIPVSDGMKTATVTVENDESVLAEQNGNICTKLDKLSLDDGTKDETTTTTNTTINGNTIETEAKNTNENTTKPEITVTTTKKKGKKGAANNNINNNNNHNTNATEPAERKDDTVDNVENHKNVSPSDELTNDGNSATVQA